MSELEKLQALLLLKEQEKAEGPTEHDIDAEIAEIKEAIERAKQSE